MGIFWGFFSSSLVSFLFFLFFRFFKISFIWGGAEAEGEAGSPLSREPYSGFDPRTLGSRLSASQTLHQLSHTGTLFCSFLLLPSYLFLNCVKSRQLAKLPYPLIPEANNWSKQYTSGLWQENRFMLKPPPPPRILAVSGRLPHHHAPCPPQSQFPPQLLPSGAVCWGTVAHSSLCCGRKIASS